MYIFSFQYFHTICHDFTFNDKWSQPGFFFKLHTRHINMDLTVLMQLVVWDPVQMLNQSERFVHVLMVMLPSALMLNADGQQQCFWRDRGMRCFQTESFSSFKPSVCALPTFTENNAATWEDPSPEHPSPKYLCTHRTSPNEISLNYNYVTGI